MNPAFKARFAPSPTGLLHLGNVRTALFNYLVARREHGVFLLRLEDTDAARGHEKFAQALQEDLRWLGLPWQEGPAAGGEHAPYAQSERGPIYQRYFDALQASGAAYPCFCSEHELEVARKTALAAGRPPRYSGRCRRLSADEARARLAAGTPATLRFHVADGETVEFEDRVRGRQVYQTSDIGDFVIRRSDGSPAFFFSNAIDDALMQVTLVLRGEDHLTNTPRQILLLRALDLPVPEYAHMALVVGADGAPLSKRTGSRSVEELRSRGFLPMAINNYLARLGHTYENNDYMSMEQLAANFAVERLHRSPARFDELQLYRWQKEAVAQLSDDELWRWVTSRDYVGGRIENFVPAGDESRFVHTVRDNVTMPQDAFLWAGNLYAQSDIYEKDARAVIMESGVQFFDMAGQSLAGARDFKSFIQNVSQATGRKGKAVFMPLRAALTGEINSQIVDPEHTFDWHAGPELARVWDLLGEARIRRRLEAAMKAAEKRS